MDFIIVSLPRSGSTWAANWLTSESVYCQHDPLYQTHYRDFDSEIAADAAGRIAGIACTGMGWIWPEWVNDHQARKLVLRRPLAEVQRRLHAIGWPPLPDDSEKRLDRIHGWHVPYTDLFDVKKARAIWGFLTSGLPFDVTRHEQLALMRIEPMIDQLVADPSVQTRLVEEILARAVS